MRGRVKFAYFVHDLLDPAVVRRVRMLNAGGADVVVFGFHRGEAAPPDVAGAPAVDLGRTYDGRMGQRAFSAVSAAMSADRWRALLSDVDVIVARSLEMLVVAHAARSRCRRSAAVVYECLDIHRLMLGKNFKSRALRALERTLLRRSALLIVSSPAFVDVYFQPYQGIGESLPTPVLLVENKVLELGEGQASAVPPPPPGRPWRIGWMGAIRCQRSLDVLSGLAARRPDLVDIRIHGRPAHREFRDFVAQVAGRPGLQFLGPYKAEELASIYGDVHFSWSIDFMEEGLNSAWLLPNRIYESSRYGAAPIALQAVETGHFVASHGLGVVLDRVDDLEAFLDGLTDDAYLRLKTKLSEAPVSTFVANVEDCRSLVANLVGAGGVDSHNAVPPCSLRSDLSASSGQIWAGN